MADVFVSYSRDDRARVKGIADALEAEGISVWWDPEILPGTTFDEVIDRELEAANCVIVVWSEQSRASRWVREEANDGLERDVLVPVLIDDVALPRGFKMVQTENMVDWAGDRTSDAWQRIMLQVRALTGTEDASAGDGAPVPTAAPPLDVPPKPKESEAARAGSGMVVLSLVAAAVLAGTWIVGTQQHSGLLTGTVALAAFAFLLFRFAESDLSPGLKAIARRWFQPVEGKVEVSAIEAFNSMFEAVFGRRHFSWKCFWRSAVASTMAFVLVYSSFSYISENFIADFMKITRKFLGGSLQSFTHEYKAMLVSLYLANVIGDYVSLLETRLVLKFAQARRKLIGSMVLLDAALTPIIFLCTFSFTFALCMALFFPSDYFGSEDPLSSVLIELSFIIPLLVFVSIKEFVPILIPGVATAFITSVWLWLALIFGPIVRLFVWSRRTGLTAVGRVLDAERRPFAALGYVTALLILVLGVSAWGVTQAIAAFT